MVFSLNTNYNSTLKGYEGAVIENNRTMPFLFCPSSNPERTRCLVILHGHGANQNFANFRADDWSIIIPLDRYGTDGLGSWWFGEYKDPFTYRMLQLIIQNLKSIYKLPAIYIWGSSMGGYGAILHGLACKAHAVYAHIPQTKLAGTHYTDGRNKRFFSPLVSKRKWAFSTNSVFTEPHVDLCKYLAKFRPHKSPVFFLTQNTFDYPFYVREHLLPFVTRCDELGFAYSVTMPLIKGHKLFLNIAQAVAQNFDKEHKKIRQWRIQGSIET
ncbi:alpha/beta hydrolase [Advenella incenata]